MTHERRYVSDEDAAALRQYGKKRCPRCWEPQPFGSFGVCSRNSDGLNSYCLACRLANAAARKHGTDFATERSLSVARIPKTQKAKADRAELAAKGMRRCTQCLHALPLNFFHGVGKREYTCARCRGREMAQDSYPGFYAHEFDFLLCSQDGRCANTRCNRPLEAGRTVAGASIDHSHIHGNVRGILCKGCNSALGLAQDCQNVLRGLADYLDNDARWRRILGVSL